MRTYSQTQTHGATLTTTLTHRKQTSTVGKKVLNYENIGLWGFAYHEKWFRQKCCDHDILQRDVIFQLEGSDLVQKSISEVKKTMNKLQFYMSDWLTNSAMKCALKWKHHAFALEIRHSVYNSTIGHVQYLKAKTVISETWQVKVWIQDFNFSQWHWSNFMTDELSQSIKLVSPVMDFRL